MKDFGRYISGWWFGTCFLFFPYIGINQLICIEDFGGRYISGWWFGTFFHILGIILPTDELIFSGGLKPPTSINCFFFGGGRFKQTELTNHVICEYNLVLKMWHFIHCLMVPK